MSKTAPIHDDIHALIIDKQTELKRKHKITVKISDLIAMYVRHGVNKTEKLLGIKGGEESDVIDDTGIKDKNGNDTEEDATIKT